MSPERRRDKESLLRRMQTAAADAPYLAAKLLPGGKSGARRGMSRPRRIAIGVGVLVLLGGAAGTMWVMSRGRDTAREVWHLHDLTVEDFRAGRFAAAVEKCRQILAKSEGDTIARYNLGAALVSLGKREEGLAEVRKAAEARPDFDDAHVLLADDAIAHGDDDTAYEHLRLATADSPTSGATHDLFAGVLRRRGRHAAAMPHLEAALLDPLTDPAIRVRAGAALGRLHGMRALVPGAETRERRAEAEAYRRAHDVADTAIAAAEASGGGDLLATLLCERAELLLAMANLSEALRDADNAVKAARDPRMRAAAKLTLAQAYVLTGSTADADRELSDALLASTAPPPESFIEAAAVFEIRGDPDRALDLLAKGCSAHANDAEIGLARANLFFRRGKLAEAEAECVRVAANDPRGAAAHLLRGDILRARDDLAGARAAYQAAAAARPLDPEPRLRIAGTAFDESGRKSADAAPLLAESARIASEILAVEPDEPGALLALAKVKLAEAPGRDPRAPAPPHRANAEARALLLRAVEGDPLSIEARTFLAYANHMVRNDQEAAFGFTELLAALPDERPRVRLVLARCLLAGGAPREALRESRRAAAAIAEVADAWRVVAEAGLGCGEREDALLAFGKLEALEPANLDHLFAQAGLLGELGRTSAAEERFAAAEAKAAAIADANERAGAEAQVATARAEFYRARGDLERGRGAFGAVLEKNPSSAGPYVRYARFLLKVGQTAEAEREVERAIAAEPASVEARRILCEIGFARGATSPLLVAQVGEVERIAPSSPVVQYLRGKLAVLTGDLALGRELLTRFAESMPDDADGQYALGVTLGRSGLFDDAIRRLETAGELMPGSPEVRLALAKVRQAAALELMRSGRFVDAKAAVRRAIADDPTAREARALLVDTLRITGEVELSEREVRGLLANDAKDRAALRMLAALQVQTRRLDEAAVTLRDLTEVAPDDWTAWQFLSAVLADKGELDRAEIAAKTCLSCAKGEPAALAPLLHVLVARGRFDAAAEEIAKARAADPKSARYPLYLAMLRHQERRFDDAATAAGEALDREPVMPEALELLVRAVARGVGDAPRAENLARARLAAAKDDAAMAFHTAALVADMGKRDEALALVEKGAAADPPLLPSVHLAAQLLIERGEHAKARALLTRGVGYVADAPDLRYLLAEAWLADPASQKAGEPAEPALGFAIAELRAVLRVVPMHAPALNNLAWLLARDPATRSEALELATRLVGGYDTYPPYLDTCGTVLLALGRKDEALGMFQKALGACEAQRAALLRLAAGAPAPIDAARNASLSARLERVTAEIKAHYAALLAERERR